MSYRHFRNLRGFFSDYYLGSVFGREAGRGRKRKLSDRTTELAAARFRRLYERAAGRSLDASECRERFVRPLLRDVFGFLLGEGENRIHPLHAAGDEGAGLAGPALALAWIGAFEEDLDAGRRSPQQQLEAELSRRGLPYGLLATGERLRLVRAAGDGPPGAGLEIDLAGLAEEPDPESFALAWKLFSAASFVPGPSGSLPLEEYEGESRRHAEKVSDDLKRAVFESAESLAGGLLADAAGRGDLADPATLSPEDLGRFRDAALLALYRLLFILYAEARDSRLDEHVVYRDSYSATGLRDEVFLDPRRAWPGNRSSLWARCLALFEIYDQGLPPIDRWENIPSRGGDFFRSDTPAGALLAAARLADDAVARLILLLTTTAPRRGVGRERISFRELDIENLGAVYEGLLEFEPRVAAEPTLVVKVQGREFALSPAELARLCAARSLTVRGPVAWVAGTAAERFHPEGEDEEETEPGELDDEEEEEDEDAEGEDSGDTEAGLKKGGSALLVRRLERGAFHFVPGPGRKGSGSFYTPRLLVQDLVRHALGPAASGRSAAEIERLRVLDPACGSGHFLVEAMRFLGMELHRAYVREHGGKAPPEFRSTLGQGWDAGCDVPDEEARAAASEARAWCKRRIAERCLFGVDWNPTAVTLAHVALWIESAAGDRPLTYFEHHVRLGNSLLGSWLDHLDSPAVVTRTDRRQTDVFVEQVRRDFRSAMSGLDELLAEARKRRLLIDEASPEDLAREGIEPESPAEWRYKEDRRREAEQALAGARLLFDLRSASLFVPEIWRDWRGLIHLLADPAALEKAARGHSWWPDFEEIRRRYRFFHWELEFPEIFLAEGRAGFDAVLGNPPWDKVLPERHAFYGRVDPLIRAFKGGELDQRIRELHATHPDLEEGFETFQRETKQVAQFLRSGGDFPHAEARSQAAHEDLSKYFLDRAARLAAEGGAVGFLVPSVVYNGDGCVGLRRFLLTEARIERFYAFENYRKKFFPIHSSYKFVNLVFRKGLPPEPFDAAFMRHDPEELTASGERPWLVRLTAEEIERYSPDTLAFLEYRSPRDQEIVAGMHKGRPTLGASGEVAGSWGSRFVSWRLHEVNFNASEDKDLWTDPATGKLYAPDSVLGFKPETFGDTLEGMRSAGFWPVFEGKHIDQFLIGTKPIRWWLSVEAAERKYGKKPRQEATLVFRETARNTDERTCIATVLPVQSVGAHTLSGGIFVGVEPDTAATVLNSICFDFALRLRVAGTHISFTYLLPMPVPPAVVARALPSLPTRSAWLDESSHITEDLALWPRLWDINRAVAEAYGLNAGDFEHILGAFPVMARKRKAFFSYLLERLEEWKREG